MLKHLALICVFASIFCLRSKASEPSVFVRYQLAKRADKMIQARPILNEPQYNYMSSFLYLDWKEGHGASVRKSYKNKQLTLHVDHEKAIHRESRCVIHTDYKDHLEGQSFHVNDFGNYSLTYLSKSATPVNSNSFVMSFADNADITKTAFEISCLGMDIYKTTLDDIAFDLNQRIEFY